jgi:hypothetical protein
MATLKVTDRELQTILSELENDLDGYLTDTKAQLRKAREEDGSASGSSPGMGALSASGSSPSAEGAPAEGGEAPPSAGAPSPEGAPPAEGAAPSPEGAAPEGAPGEEGMEGAPGQEGPVDPAALEAEYSKLPLPELQAHYLACKAALFAQMGGGAGAPEGAPAGAPPAGPSAAPPMGAPPGAPPMGAPGPSAGAPPMGAGAPPPMAPPAGPPGQEQPPMAMSEMGTPVAGVSQSGNGGEFSKSEVDAIKVELEKMTKIVNLFVGQPIRKAITGFNYVDKNGGAGVETPKITPTQITAKLSQLTRDPDLKKSDRDLVNRYYEGTANVDAIAHLLK